MKYQVGDIVKKIETYWYGNLNEPRDDIGKLYVISEVSGGYEIRDLETGGTSAWWHDDQLEFVRHGEENIFKKLDKLYNEITERNNDLNYIKKMYPDISSTSWLKLFDEISYKSGFKNNGEYYALASDIIILKPIFDRIFDNDINEALSILEVTFKSKYVDKYKKNIKKFYNKLHLL